MDSAPTQPTKKELKAQMDVLLTKLNAGEAKLNAGEAEAKNVQAEIDKLEGKTPEPVSDPIEESEDELLKKQAELLEAQKENQKNINASTEKVNSIDTELDKLAEEKDKIINGTTTTTGTTPTTPRAPSTPAVPPTMPPPATPAVGAPTPEPISGNGRINLSKLEADEQRRIVLVELAKEAVAESNQEITDLETGPPPRVLTEDEKVEIYRDNFKYKIQASQKDRIKESGFANSIEKGQRWWDSLDKSTGGRIAKVALSTTLIGGTALLTGSAVGLIPGGLGARLATRVGIATGISTIINMAQATNVPKKIMGIFRGGNETDIKLAERSRTPEWIKKHITLGNVAMVAGVGAVWIMSGGAMALVAAGGIGAKWLVNTLSKAAIKAGEGKKDEVIEKIDVTIISGGEDALINYFTNLGTEYDKVEKGLNNVKAISTVTKGAVGMLAGLESMHQHALHPDQGLFGHAKVEHKGTEEPIAKSVEEPVRGSGTEPYEKFNQHTSHDKNFVDAPPPEQTATNADTTSTEQPVAEDSQNNLSVNKDAIVHQGKGITYAFAEQIKHNPSLAKDLGYEGDVNDKGEMAKFVRDLAIKTGYMDKAGHEIRVGEGDTVAYEIKVDNGQIVVEEKMVDTGSITDTHQEGDALEEKTEAYEYKHDGGTPHTENNMADHTDTNSKFVPPPHVDTVDHHSITPDHAPTNPVYVADAHGADHGNHAQTHQAHTENKPAGGVTGGTKGGELPPQSGNGDYVTSGGYSIEDDGNGRSNLNYNVRGGSGGHIDSDHVEHDQHPEYKGTKYYDLSERQFLNVSKVYEHKIDDIFPNNEVDHEWDSIKDSRDGMNAHTMMELDKASIDDKNYEDLYKYMHKLQKWTGLDPKTIADGSKQNETVSEYLQRALQKAAQKGILKKFR